MLKYKILASQTDNYITIPFEMDNNVKNHDEYDTLIDRTADEKINPIIDYEKEGYIPNDNFKLQFQFWNNDKYVMDWVGAGFDIAIDKEKNVFKKSLFLLEFFDSNISKNNLLFATTLSVYPNFNTAKGCDTNEDHTLLFTSFTVKEIRNELYLLFFKRDIKSSANLKTDNIGNYVPVYMKAMFLNAKNGKVHYFMNNDSVAPINNEEFSNSLFYYEIRFYENYTYSFVKNDLLSAVVNFNEIKIV